MHDDQALALLVVGDSSHREKLLSRAGNLVQLVFNLYMWDHLAANFAESAEAVGDNDLSAEHVVHAKSPEQELSQLAMQSMEGYFRSHPATSDRIAQVQRVIAEEHWQDRTTQRPFYMEYSVHNGEPAKHD